MKNVLILITLMFTGCASERMASVYNKLHLYRAAEKTYGNTIEKNIRENKYVECSRCLYFYKGEINYFNLKRYDDALNDFTCYIELAPDSFSGYFTRAAVYHDMGKYDLSINDYKKSLTLYSPDSYADVYSNLMVTEIALGHINLAIEYAGKCIESDSSDVELFIHRAELYYGIKEYSSAIDDYFVYLDKGKNKKSIDYCYYSIAYCFYYLEDFEKAEMYFKKSADTGNKKSKEILKDFITTYELEEEYIIYE